MNIRTIFSLLSDKDECYVLLYLIQFADSESQLNRSFYAIARDLKIHRQSLMRIIGRLSKAGLVTMQKTEEKTILTVLVGTTKVTASVSQDVTLPMAAPVTQQEMPQHPDAEEIERHAETLSVTLPMTQNVTHPVTEKEETKQKNKEVSPAPLQEEKKQKKEEKTPSCTCVCRSDAMTILEKRRQRFVSLLAPYIPQYGQEMISQFADYWTEPNRSLTKLRYELQVTWSTAHRLATWARHDKIFNHHNNSNSNNHENNQRKYSADFIADAQRHAIEETERFIRAAEIRRGGVPPHLPF